jgi:hypothetical protein
MPIDPQITAAAVTAGASAIASLITALAAAIIRRIEKGPLDKRLQKLEEEAQISNENKNKDNDATPAF